MENTIFVQIASYRDPQLVPTLNSLIHNSKHPENLKVSICWQHGPDETLENFTSQGYEIVSTDVEDIRVANPITTITKMGAVIQLIDTHFHKTQGACWARNQVQQLFDDEKYTLQLDSHHRFIKNWDTVLIDMVESLRKDGVAKPLLTAYIPSFDPENDPGDDYDPVTNKGARVGDAWKMDFDRFIPEGAVFFLPSTIDEWRTLDKPVPSRFYSGHFAFGDGSFAVEVQHDPYYFFHGEEISIAARAYTHGYDLFHPHLPVVWDEYTRKGRVKVWDDHTTGQKNKGRVDLDWVERNNLCHKRNRILFGMDGEDPAQIDFGKYGFGKTRTLRQYEEYSGLSFKYRGVQQKTIDRQYPPNNVPYTTEEEWKDTFARSNDLRICLHKNELFNDKGELEKDYDFFYVGAHDAEGNELYRKDLQEAEITRHLQHEWIDYRFIFFSKAKPVEYRVWPHSKTAGWGKLIVKPVTEG